MPYKRIIFHEDGSTLKEIAEAFDIDFSSGEGFYQLIKKEKVSSKKKLVLFKNNKYFSDNISKILKELRDIKGGGDIEIKPANIPQYSQLYVQSTSSNRKIPKDAAVLFTVESEEGDEAEASGGDNDDEDDDGNESSSLDEDDLFGPEVGSKRKAPEESEANKQARLALPPSRWPHPTGPGYVPYDNLAEVEENFSPKVMAKIAKHVEKCNKHAKTAKKYFLDNTKLYKWTGQMGEYLFRGLVGHQSMTELEYDWPRAFCGMEGQYVNAALWQISPIDPTKTTLVCIWTYSEGGDESCSFWLQGPFLYDDLAGFEEEYEALIEDEDMKQLLSASCMDEAVKHLYCPVLENMTLEELLRETA